MPPRRYIATGEEEYDRKVSLIHRAFNAIAKLVYHSAYELDAKDWELLDSARLDSPILDYEQLHAVLSYAYKQIKRKIAAQGRQRG